MSKDHETHGEKKLGQFLSTAICGNDILSSVLYVAGIAVVFAGIYAPIVLLMVAFVLFFYRTVYREVVEALPINGGAYNALLNGTSKTVAATAGVMTILSYTATAVISAKTAVEYLFQFLEELSRTYHWALKPGTIESMVNPIVILILFLFAALVISGLRDSAKVALTIFATHIGTLLVFVLFGILAVATHGFGLFHSNVLATQSIVSGNGGLVRTIFYGFSASLLGVSGFESSANFVEEQQKGVFKKTLRNMTLGIIVFNPLIAFLILSAMPLHAIIAGKDYILTIASFSINGIPLAGLIAIDGFFVLCGAVLTAFVGVSGLANRMTLDECLPSFLIKENSKGAHPRIVIAFFLFCSSILILTGGNLLSLAGVYTISFLSVMSLFALGNLILRQSRGDLKRPYRAPIVFVFLAFISTFVGIIGNIVLDVRNAEFFLLYFVPTFTLVIGLIYKRDVARAFARFFKKVPPIYSYFHTKYLGFKNSTFYVFVHHTDKLFRTLDYINTNENGCNVVLLHCSNGDDGEREDIKNILPMFKKAGAFPDFNITFEYVDKPFGPEAIDYIAKKKKTQKNRIFIGSIHDFHDFDYDELGGVRIIS